MILVSCSKDEIHGSEIDAGSKVKEKKVLYIGIDGVRADAFELLMEANKLPNLKQLLNNGVYFNRATTSDLTGSWGGWSDALRGVHRDKHEAGYWGQNVAPGPELLEFVNYPDLFTRLEQYNSELNTMTFITWDGLANSLNSADVRIFRTYNDYGDNFVTTKAVERIETEDPDLVYFYQADPDIAGHNNGFGPNRFADKLNEISAGYQLSIIEADRNAGKVLNAINSRPGVANGSEKWLVIVTSDHGGTNGGHSQNGVAERHVPMIISGINLEIPEPSENTKQLGLQPKNIDIVPTILNYFEIPKSSQAWEKLDGYDILDMISYERELSYDKNLLFNGDAEYDVGFNGKDELIRDGAAKASERDWPNEGKYWDQAISGWDDWTETPSRQSMTIAFYGSGFDDTFLTESQASTWDGGKNFFCAGINGNSVMEQLIDVSTLTKESGVSYELSAWLGGSKSVSDNASIILTFLKPGGTTIDTVVMNGASATERDNLTQLIFKEKSGVVPVNTHSVKIELKVNGKYGFADNISFKIKN